MNYRIDSSEFGCAATIDNHLSHASQARRSMRSAITIAIGSTNIFTATLARASGRCIKPAGLASLRNSSSNKATTAQLQSPIHSRIYERPIAMKIQQLEGFIRSVVNV